MEDLTFGPRANATPALVRFVTQEYGLGQVETAGDLGGTYNLNLLVKTAGKNLVIRVYRPWTTREWLVTIQTIKGKLSVGGFPVIVPLAALDGQTCLEYEKRLVEVEEYLPHEQSKWDWADYLKSFASLASFHDFLRENIDTTLFVPALVSNYASPKTLLEWLGNFEEVVQDREAYDVCARTRQLLQKTDRFYEERARNLPRQLTHGDWRAGNILFENNHLTAVLDFDFLDVRERIFDLAYTLYWMFADLEPSRAAANLSWPRVKEMLAAYNSVAAHKLTGAEIEALPVELALVPLYWVGEALIGPGLLSTLPNYARSAELAGWILDHADQLQKLFLP